MFKKNYIETITSYNIFNGYAEQYFEKVVVPTLKKLNGYTETEYLGAQFSKESISLMYLRISDNPEYNDLSFYKEITSDEFLEYIEGMKTVKSKVDHYMQFTFEQLCDAVEELECAISDAMDNTSSYTEFLNKSKSLREDIDAATIAKVMKQTGDFVKYEMMDEFDQDCVMTRQSFVAAVKECAFTNDDGYGVYAKDKTTKTNVPCVPSDIYGGYIREDFDYVVWWNK